MDGVVLPSNDAGIGAVIRDDQGDFIAAMGAHTHHWDSATVELQAITSFKQIIQP